MAMIHYVDPAGNMTAIVRGEFGNEKRVELAKQILQQEKAEQVKCLLSMAETAGWR